jgi:hypothetical protein
MIKKPKVVKIPGKIDEQLQKFRDLFTSPSFENFSYMVSAITACTDPKNIQNLHGTIADTCEDKKDYQTYRYFFGKAKWDENEIAQRKADIFFKSIGAKKGELILIVVDDTLNKKKGKKTFGVGWFQDHSNGNYVWANNIVTSALQYKECFIPHKARIYVKEEDAEKWNVEFRTKPDIAYEEIIKPLKIPTCVKGYVVVDAAYFDNKKFVDNCKNKYEVIGRVKYNRIIVQKDGSEINVRDHFNKFSLEEHKKKTIKVRGEEKTYWTVEDVVYLKSLKRKIKIVASKKDLDEDANYYGCTETNLSGKLILSLYENRWNIETVHKESNQKLGFKDYQVRSKDSIERSFQIIFLVWTILLLLEFDKNGAADCMQLLSEMLGPVETMHFTELFYSICDYLGMTRPPLGDLTQCLQDMGYVT